jgi:hypothetical protein
MIDWVHRPAAAARTNPSCMFQAHNLTDWPQPFIKQVRIINRPPPP